MQKPDKHSITFTDTKNAILSVLAYYDLFSFPITREEVCLFAGVSCKPAQLQLALDCLLSCGLVFEFGNYYTLKNDPHLITRRQNGAHIAAGLLQTASKVSSILIRFPYVRGIAVSGSLSKKYADSNSDIDLFVITAANRLWIARTLLHFFKKLSFLFNKQHYLCMNYFVDEKRAEIAEKNLFTAVETLTLIPLQGDVAFEQFYSANTWTRYFLPNNLLRISTAKTVKPGLLKRFAEALFNTPIGDAIDNWLMHITATRWRQKTEQGRLNMRGVLMSMLASKGCAKPDPRNFQARVLNAHQEKLQKLIYQSERQAV